MTAEYALRQTLGSHSNVHVQSAGLIDAPHDIVSFVSDYLLRRGIDTATHRPRKLSAGIMASATLIVAMDFEHQREVHSQYGVKSILFNELAYGKALPMPDVDEVVPDWRNNEAEASRYCESVMDGIFDGMPGFIERMSASF
jgi:protein-tyrosine-phosphatase